MRDHKSPGRLIWGWALLLMGVMVFFRIPAVMPRIEQIAHYAKLLPYIRFCLYMMGVFLIAGGAMKIHAYYRNGSAPADREKN